MKSESLWQPWMKFRTPLGYINTNFLSKRNINGWLSRGIKPAKINQGDNVPSRHLCLQVKSLVPGMGYIMLSHLPNKYRISGTIAKAANGFLQPDDKASCWGHTCYQHGEFELVPS